MQRPAAASERQVNGQVSERRPKWFNAFKPSDTFDVGGSCGERGAGSSVHFLFASFQTVRAETRSVVQWSKLRKVYKIRARSRDRKGRNAASRSIGMPVRWAPLAGTEAPVRLSLILKVSLYPSAHRDV